jgi:hypothetical protein
MQANILRVKSPKVLVVILEETGSIVELTLKIPLSLTHYAHAKLITPFTPRAAHVTLGFYKDNAFHDSEVMPVSGWSNPAPRMNYRDLMLSPQTQAFQSR